MDHIVDIEFDKLEVRPNLLKALGLKHPPSWNQIFCAIKDVVESTPEDFTRIGSAVMVATSADSGKCLIYAAITGAVLNAMISNELGMAAGGIAIYSVNEPDRYYSLPPDLDRPNISGGYHAWNVIRSGDLYYVVDMSYHWFRRHNKDHVGPDNFLIALPETLTEAKIGYHPHQQFTDMVGGSLLPKDVTQETLMVLERLRPQ